MALWGFRRVTYRKGDGGGGEEEEREEEGVEWHFLFPFWVGCGDVEVLFRGLGCTIVYSCFVRKGQ